MNLLEIGKIVRPHGIKGAVKILSYIDVNFSKFRHIYISSDKIEGNITKVQTLNNDAYAVTVDIIDSVEKAEKYRNATVYIDRSEYENMKDKLYLSDLIGKDVVNEHGEKIGNMVDYDDYGASVILTIRSGSVSYSIPYVEEIIRYDRSRDVFEIKQQTFEDLKV